MRVTERSDQKFHNERGAVHNPVDLELKEVGEDSEWGEIKVNILLVDFSLQIPLLYCFF